MTEKLVSDSELASLAEIAETGMQTEVQIFARTTNRDFTSWDDSSDKSEQYATDPVVALGWLREMPDYGLSDDFQVVVHVEDARLFLPLTVEVQRGDKVVVNGEEFAVIDDNRNNTYRVLTRVALRRSH